MEAENDHGTDGDIDNDLGFELISAAPEVDDGDDREETNYEIEDEMNEDVTLIDMPKEKDEANGEGGDANDKVFFVVRFFQIAGLTD